VAIATGITDITGVAGIITAITGERRGQHRVSQI
jgi:hypothetical protein